MQNEALYQWIKWSFASPGLCVNGKYAEGKEEYFVFFFVGSTLWLPGNTGE
jgi:hypothetical protein